MAREDVGGCKPRWRSRVKSSWSVWEKEPTPCSRFSYAKQCLNKSMVQRAFLTLFDSYAGRRRAPINPRDDKVKLCHQSQRNVRRAKRDAPFTVRQSLHSGVHPLLETTTDRRNVRSTCDANSDFSTRTRTDKPSKIGISGAKSAKNDITEPGHLGPHDPVAVQTEPGGKWMHCPAANKRPSEDPSNLARCHHHLRSNPIGQVDKPSKHVPFLGDPKQGKHRDGRPVLGLLQQVQQSAPAKSPEVRAATARPLDKVHLQYHAHEAIARLSFQVLDNVKGPHLLEAVRRG